LSKISVLVVGPPALSRVIKHLLAAEPDFEVIGSGRGLKSLSPGKKLPILIVASVRAVRSGVGDTVRAIKGASPSSKLILLCPFDDFAESGRRYGADACLNPDKLVAQLIPTASALTPR
jgi:hypothetical protein